MKMKKEVKMEDRVAGYRAEYKKKLDKISINRIGEKFDNLSKSQKQEIEIEFKKNHSDYIVQPENVHDALKLEELIKQIPLRGDFPDPAYSKFTVLTDEAEIANAQNTFVKNLKKYTTKKASAVIGFPGPEESVTDDVEYISSANFWWHTRKLVDEAIPRYWNCFGLGEPSWGKNNNIVLEINPPIKGTSRRTKGAFVKDQDGNIHLTHNGVLGGGNTPGGFYDVYPHEDRWIEAEDGKDEPRELILISDITSSKLPEFIADYVENVAKYKSGELISKKVPFYLLLRHKSEDNPYEDDPSGKVYHFPKIANYTKVVRSAKAIWFDRKDGDYYFWGFGTISEVKPRSDMDYDAIFDDFTLFKKEPDSLELFGKFLKKATPTLQQKIVNHPGWNAQNSILEINKEIYNEIIGIQEVDINQQKFEIGHELFKIEMQQRESKTAFKGFDHPDFVKDEVDFKNKIWKNAQKVLSLEKWEEWLATPEKIIDVMKKVCESGKGKTSENLLMSPARAHPDQKGSADSLLVTDLKLKNDYAKQLYAFFKGPSDESEFGKRFSNLVTFLEENNLYFDWRFITYLSFLVDKTKYFPVLVSKFNAFLNFFEFSEKLSGENVSWEQYSFLIQLIKALGQKLADYRELSFVEIHSYLWILAGLVSRNYWLVHPGSGGGDWENQKQAGLVGIHYYTMDLSKFTTQNKQLSKPKIQKRMQEIRQEQGEDPDPQSGMDADFGQFSKIFSARPKDKIVAIGDNSTLLGIGNATGKYQFRTDISRNCHTVPVDWYDVNSRQIPQQDFRRAIKELSVKDYVNIMSSQTTSQSSHYQEFINILDKKKQLLFYGPPGTGKTYTAKKLSEEMIKNNSSTSTLTFRAAAIKILSEENASMHYEEITRRALEKNLIQTKGETPEFTLLKEMSYDIQKNGASSIFKKVSKGNYSLNPDVELDEELKETGVQKRQFIRNVTFHQSYSYEEFIEGIKPHSIDGKVVYTIEPGIFRIICDEAAADPNNKYVLVIDEINRGDISKIFGELITLIEKDKRETYDLQLAYSKDNFTIPENIYIIGTLNTADRSLIQIDAALRRRFAFCELMPKPEILKQTIEGISLRQLLEEINKRIIEAGLREKQVGHTYLMDVQKLDDLQFVFANEIIPLLQDYFFDDYKKLEEDILSSDFIDSEKMIVKEEWKQNPQTFLESLKNTFQL